MRRLRVEYSWLSWAFQDIRYNYYYLSSVQSKFLRNHHSMMKRNKKNNKTNMRFSLCHSHNEQQQKDRQFCGSQFRNTRLFMDIVKKCEKMIFRERECEMEENMRLLNQQNNLMETLKHVNLLKSYRDVAPASSIKVLEELDLNKKQAYESLEMENKNLRHNIQQLELTLESLEKLEKSHTLCPEYLGKLEKKMKKREKLRLMLAEKVETESESIQSLKAALFEKYNGKDTNIAPAVQLLLK